MSCLDDLVNISGYCATGEPSTAKLDLLRAPELSKRTLAQAAGTKYINGYNLAFSMLENAHTDVQDDLQGALLRNGYIADLTNVPYETSRFNSGLSVGASNAQRGVTIYPVAKGHSRGIRRTRLTKVQVYPVSSYADARLLIIDNGQQYAYNNVNLTGGVINEIEIAHTVAGQFARVVVDAGNMDFYKTELTCFEGCHGQLPNTCGYVRGYNGISDVRDREGFGVNVTFECYCDLNEIFCVFKDSYVAKLIYNKTRILLLDERIHSDRLNDFVVFGKDEAEELLAEVTGEYDMKFNELIASMPKYLQTIRDSCITCKKPSWIANG